LVSKYRGYEKRKKIVVHLVQTKTWVVPNCGKKKREYAI